MSTPRFTQTVQSLGTNFNQTTDITTDGAIKRDPTVPAAKAGSLTTRTDNTNGVITFAGGHGFISTDKLDIYWQVGGVFFSRRAVVATVAVNAVTITGGAGDNLPVVATQITGMKPQVEACDVTGDNVKAIIVNCPVAGTITFTLGDGTVVKEYNMPTPGRSEMWNNLSGVTNPLAGAAVAKCLFSHADAGAAQKMNAHVYFD